MTKFRVWYQIEEEDDNGDHLNVTEESSLAPVATLEAAQEQVSRIESFGEEESRTLYLHDEGGNVDSIDGLPDGWTYQVLLWDHNDMLWEDNVRHYSAWIASQDDMSDDAKRELLHDVLDRVDEPSVVTKWDEESMG